MKKRIGYKDAGVNIDEGDRAVALIRKHARGTFTRDVLTDIGSFGAGYLLAGWKNPVLVSSADGVGTKLKIAFQTGRHNTVGEDLVNHCVNDIAVQGAVPLFFLDYFAAGKLDAEVTGQVIEGVARGCRNNSCALIGGETAEMPGLYQPGEYDLAGFIVGAVERNEMLTGKTIRAGDVLVGLASNGLHTNGYSLARKLLFEVAEYRMDPSLQEELLKVHRSYLKPIRGLIDAKMLKGAAHITGGGITGNLPRILPEGLAARIDVSTWTIPPIFERLRDIGEIDLVDYRRTFNLGIGMILVVAKRNVAKMRATLAMLGEPCPEIGEVIEGRGERVVYVGDTGARG
ncbi:MAG TPA: phosphoribosylformylglycinamidine cyclo-ligase [Bryobacteraceae bacterium]|nr:phosphoribosylformylglycinamidine cyclo-ligase [Bryobacteraceae bacterium]